MWRVQILKADAAGLRDYHHWITNLISALEGILYNSPHICPGKHIV